MATTLTPSGLLTRARVFKSVADSEIQAAIDEAERWMCESNWGPSHYNDGVFYLAAHILAENEMLNSVETPAETGDAIAAGPLRSERILSWSASYESASDFDDAWATTAWGRRFIARRDCVFSARIM